MAYKEFKLFRTKNIKEARVTIVKTGTMNFNSFCVRKYFETKKWIVFMFDEERRRIAFKCSVEKEESSYMMRDSKGIGTVSARALLNHYGISFQDCSRSHPVHWDEEFSMPYINLDEGKKVGVGAK